MSEYTGKRVVVAGLAGTGLATARLLLQQGAQVLVTDRRSYDACQPWGDQLLDLASRLPGDLKLEMNGHRKGSFVEADLVVLSPGVPMAQEAILAAKQAGVEVISEVELAFRHLRGKVIGITGSNGKTTTTSLVHHLIVHAGGKAFLAGNIGPPLVSFVGLDDEETLLVTELSSFQLEGTVRMKCRTAVLLNITPDHLDRYPSFEEYGRTKARIFLNQAEEDLAVINGTDPVVARWVPEIRGRILRFSLDEPACPGIGLNADWIEYRSERGSMPLLPISNIPLKGRHNVENVMAALGVGLFEGIPRESMIEAIRTFTPVEHRLEWAGEVEGVTFYNDSKATNMDSCIKALQAFTNPVLLILGGRNKGGDFGELRDWVSEKVVRIFAIGESVQQIQEALLSTVGVTCCGSMREAVEKAYKQSHPGDTVLLAPACASFDMFQNFEHRGKVFKAEVERLKRQSHPPTVH